MGTILQPARFVSEMGIGYILFSDGSNGAEVTSRSEALLQMRQAKGAGKLCDEEVASLITQIRDAFPTPPQSDGGSYPFGPCPFGFNL